MADDLSIMWKNLSLMDDECLEWKALARESIEVIDQGQFYVIGKLIAERMVSKETIKTTFLRWWKLEETFSFKILGENLFLVEFMNATDKK